MDKSSNIFGNKIDEKTLKKAWKTQKKFLRKFGDDRKTVYHLAAVEHPVVTPELGIKILFLSKEPLAPLPEKSIIIGNIRMGFGHYRISMAMASAARSMGYTPLWLDLNSFPETTCTKIISYQNDLYSLGSRLSQKFTLFNKLYWEPLNSEGFRQLTYNAVDQAASELMTPVFHDIPKDIPYVATHAWPSQAAVHAGMKKVVNAVPDNWPMALHLSEGALHTIQTPSSYIGYRTLRGMAGKKILHPMSDSDILYTGHYIDHEFLVNLETDCKARIDRARNGKPLRFLLTIGGAGAQGDFFGAIVRTLLPFVKEGRATLFINVGDYLNVWNTLQKSIPELDAFQKDGSLRTFIDDWNGTKAFAEKPLDGITVFCNKDIFAAVYATNLLIRQCDVLVTKPSELAFYPVPKLHIRRVGGHEMWGAIHSAEVGDGTYECSEISTACEMARRFIEDPDMLCNMCEHILTAQKAGIYDGAYKAVEAAINRQA